MRVSTLAAALALVIVVSGCGGDDAGGPDPESTSGAEFPCGSQPCPPDCATLPDGSGCSRSRNSDELDDVCLAGVCVDCLSDRHCVGDKRFCDAGSNTCGECATSASCDGVCDAGECVSCGRVPEACDAERPYCTADFECVECRDDSDCGAGPCGFGGVCLAPKSYVDTELDAAGSSVIPCGTEDTPRCASLQDALASLTESRKTVYVRPTDGAFLLEETLVLGESELYILGATEGRVVLRSASDELIRVETGAVVLRNLTLQPGSVGVACSPRAQLSLSFIILDNAGETGLVSECLLSVSDSRISNGDGVGIRLESSASIERTTVADNAGGGISVTASRFTIANSFVTKNGTAGSAGSDFGGMRFGPDARAELQHVTLADNDAGDTAISSALTCDSRADFTLARSVVWGKRPGLRLANGPCAGPFTSPDNLVESISPDAAPAFAAPDSGDYRLTANSDARDRVSNRVGLEFDHDRRARPRNSQWDLGAHEYLDGGQTADSRQFGP